MQTLISNNNIQHHHHQSSYPVLPEDQHQHQHHHQQQQHPPQQHNLHHQGYTTTTHLTSTMPALNQAGGLQYTPIVTSETSQYCSSSEFLNCSTSSTSTSSSASNSPCLSSNSSSSSLCDKKSSTPSIGVNLRVTGQCSQGGRKYMEDYFSVAYQQSENAKDLEYAFIGIYDGHGGAEAATFAKEHLMMEIINQRLFWSDSDHDVLRAIREGYIATHYAMWREQDKWPKTANGLPSTAGTTATVAFIRREKIYIGHVGDSGIVLGYQNENENFWRAKQLTVDHKPESVEERTRIMKSGGKVVVKSGVPRVVWNRPRNASHRGPIKHKTPVDEIPFLAVARSLGDLWSYNSERNEFVVSPDPDVKVIPINPKTFRCLIFGTDGLWNVVNAQEAVNTVREKEIINERLQAQRGDSPHEGNQWTNPSKSLVDQALSQWSAKKMRADNTSVVTVILYPPGQGGHNNTTQIPKDVGSLATPPAFVQPASYGLEYTQVQAEIPAYDDATTYKEMAMKYLPPEEYRNFNYYADDSDHADEADTDESDSEETEAATKSIIESATNPHTNYQLQTNNWNWQHSNAINNTTINNTHQHHHHHVAEEEPGYAEDGEDDDEEDIEEEEEDDDDEEEEVSADVVDSSATNVTTNLPNSRNVCVIDYQNYLQIGNEETNNATDDPYINTFAESYNTLLSNGQTDCATSTTVVTSVITPTNSNSNSSSNSSNCQSVSPPNMHALIEEQQLYRQQCMSEEDGYSLTKLETRREQQTCKSQGQNSNVQVDTFKFFHHTNGEHHPHQQQQQHHHSNHQLQDTQNMTVYTTSTERYYQQHTTTTTYMPQKPLELHSLLQQEREEEQQVAYERQQQQMQDKLAIQQQNISAYACLQAAAVRHETETCLYMPDHQIASEENSQDVVMEKVSNAVLESEEDLIEEVDEDEVEVEDEIIAELEPSVQINEISSSSSGDEEILQELDEKMDTFIQFNTTNSCSKETPTVVEKIEKIEILPEVSIYKISKNTSIERRQSLNEKRICLTASKTANSSCLPPPPPPQSPVTPTPVKSGQRVPSRHFVYATVQNENMVERVSVGKNKHSLYNTHGSRRSLNMTPTSSTKPPPALIMTPPTASSTPMIQRQLRSNSSNTPLDYGKRTLRTRNSLTKDMKAKSALVQAAIKYPHNTRKFLQRTGAAAALFNLQDQHLNPTNRRSLTTTTSNGCSANRSIKTTRNSSNNSTPLTQTPHLNLRSRQSSASVSAVATPNLIHLNNSIDSLNGTPPPPASASTPVIKRASLADRRNLRTIHTRSSPRIGPPTQANFSKTTRSQSTGTNLAVRPPPSPKMINNAAAVAAAATRARSLISQQRAAQANGTASVVSAVFGKRVNLRSHGGVAPPNGGGGAEVTNAISTGHGSTTHQTLRGRVVKKFKR